jgi:hypothetical protein
LGVIQIEDLRSSEHDWALPYAIDNKAFSLNLIRLAERYAKQKIHDEEKEIQKQIK